MSHLVRQLERLLKKVERILQFPLGTQEGAGVAHHACHSIFVTRLLVDPERLVIHATSSSEVPFLGRNQAQVHLFSRLTLLIADGSSQGQGLAVQLFGRREIPLIDGDFSSVVQRLRQTEAISCSFIDLSSFFTVTLSFFVFAKVG